MTCIIGFVSKDRIYIGGDSAGIAGYHKVIRVDEKVFKKDKMIFGFTSSFRMGQLIRYKLKIPEQKVGQDDMEFMTNNFIDALRDCLKDGGFAEKNNSAEVGGTFLVGYKRHLYQIEENYQVGCRQEPFDAVGCGQDIALGALFVLRFVSMNPCEKIRRALVAAERYNTNVARPFLIKYIRKA